MTKFTRRDIFRAIAAVILMCVPLCVGSVHAQEAKPVTETVPTSDTLPSGSTRVTPTPANQDVPQPLVLPPPAPSPSNLQKAENESAQPRAQQELPSVPEVAPGYKAPVKALQEMSRVGVDFTEQRPLTIREAIEMALLNNKDIEVARANVKIAEFDLLGARGFYDPRLSTFSYYERSVTPISSLLSGGGLNAAVTESDVTGTVRFEGLTPKYGGNYRVDFSSVRLVTDNVLAALNPQYPSALTFNYTQPLVRGFGFDNTRRQIEVAKKNLSLTDAQFRQRTIETITSVQTAYWDLVYALRTLQIQRDAVKDSRTQLEHNKRLVVEGLLAPIDVVAVEAQVAGFEQGVYSALEDISRAENNLKSLIAENRSAAIWNVTILPTDPVDLTAPVVSLDDAMQAAIENRAELTQSDVVLEINKLDQRFYREQTKPQVDLVATYGAVGLAGSLNVAGGNNPITGSSERTRLKINEIIAALPNSGIEPLSVIPQTFPTELLGGFDQSLSNLGSNRYNNFRVGIQLSLPLRNRTAEAQLGRSVVEGQRIQTQREQLEQLIQVDVRNALQIVRTVEARLQAAAAMRSASEQQYQSEQRRFDAGQSTLFLVLERQTALTTARGNELRAQTDLNKAIAELQRATGNAIQANNVVVRVR